VSTAATSPVKSTARAPDLAKVFSEAADAIPVSLLPGLPSR